MSSPLFYRRPPPVRESLQVLQNFESNEYQKLDQLGRGGFGTVYKVRMNDGKLLACKEIDGMSNFNDSEQLELVQIEVRQLRCLDHQNIVKFVGISQDAKFFCIFTELIDGAPLARLISEKALQIPQVRRISRQVCQALQFMHEQNPRVLHRDIKGENIMVGYGDSVTLIDFGLTMQLKLPDTAETSGHYTVTRCGTRNNMAPEIKDGDVSRYSAASDIYAFGCTVKRMYEIGRLQPDGLQKNFYEVCLYTDPKKRWSANRLLCHQFLTSEEITGLTDVMLKVGLIDEFPEKICVRHLLTEVAKPQKVRRRGSLGRRLLASLLEFDCRARDSVCEFLPSASSAQPNYHEFDFEDGSSDADFLHPMDALLACFLCCDKEVQQMLSQRLFTCKLAFPFALMRDDRCEMLRWSLKDILLEYRNSQDEAVDVELTSATDLPVVSFVRLGDLQLSKSRLLNFVLHSDGHSTFFNRHCQGGSRRRQLTNGFVEASVFLPSGSSSSSSARVTDLRSPFIAVNVRGDLLKFTDLTDFVMKLSHVIVVVVNVDDFGEALIENSLNQLDTGHSRLIAIGCRKEGGTTSSILLKNKVDNFRRHFGGRIELLPAVKGQQTQAEADVAPIVFERLQAALDSVQSSQSSLDIQDDLPNDEQNFDISDVRTKTKEIFKASQNCPVLQFKTKFLSLQGELWVEYSKLYKEENSANKETQNPSDLQSRRSQIRNQQVNLHNQNPDFICEFASQLLSCIGNHESQLSAKLLLQCMRLQFDKTSRRDLPLLYTRLHICKDALIKAERGTSKEKVKLCQDKCSKAERNLLDASVGLENVFREIGQLYEASRQSRLSVTSRIHDKVSLLPEVFARLLLAGIPLEILDGDVSNISLTWVTEVLQSCHSLIGDKKLFVVSVLGIQSSGKSTLLNTMFGLKFPVSAGRCTRGAFLQLVEVDKESGLKFDFLAVIDTEGLRAPELGRNYWRHDNELATLAVGLGDVTIVNVKGENRFEIDDILQIVVQAFIRMKEADSEYQLQRSCVFIHQNVPATLASEKLRSQKNDLQRRLDKIA